jgi:hypothetical protein
LNGFARSNDDLGSFAGGVDDGVEDGLDDGADDDDSNEYPQLLSCFNHSNACLHDCGCYVRDASISKADCERLLSLIYSGLPIPNTMPRTMKDLLAQMNGKKNRETLARKDRSAQYRESHLTEMNGLKSVPWNR